MSRRRALKSLIIGSALAMLYPLVRLIRDNPKFPSKRHVFIDHNKLEKSKFPLLEKGIWVVKEDNRYMAFENRCTHLGCPLSFKDGLFVCQCHGSRFSISGKRLKGPAKRDLPKLRVKILGDGTLRIMRTTL